MKTVPNFKTAREAAEHLHGLWVMSPEKTLMVSKQDSMPAHIAKVAQKSELEIARNIPLDGFYYNRLKEKGPLRQNDPVKLVISNVQGNRIEMSTDESLVFNSNDEMAWYKNDEVMIFVRRPTEKKPKDDKATQK